jgi:hypothetical protein
MSSKKYAPYTKVTIDIETNGLGGAFIIGGIYNIKLNQYKSYTNENDYWTAVLNLKRAKIYAHFGGKYDYQYMINWILKNKPELKFEIIYNSKIIMIKIETLYFYDTYNIFLSSLGNIEKAFGISRNESKETAKIMSIDYYNKNKKQVEAYLKEDCINLAKAIEKFEEITSTKIKATIASTAFSYFFNNFQKDLKFQRQDDFLKSFLRKGYFGGRTEVFKRYGENLFYYDINSSYPYIMQKFEMPLSEIEFTKEYRKNRIGFYDIVVTDYNVNMPYIAKKWEGKLLYPLGTFQAYVTNLEIEELIKDKQKFKVVRGFVFHKIQNIFKDYIDYFYNMKMQAKSDNNQALYWISKIFMNSLYGKFGEREEKQKIVKLSDKELFDLIQKGRKVYPFSPKNKLYYLDDVIKSDKIQIQIASWITAFARFRLYRIMRKLVNNGFEVYYCDTDSIVTNASEAQMKMLGIPIDDLNLGALKLENEIQRGYFLLPKFYNIIVNNKSKSKNKGFSCDFSEELFKDFLFSNKNSFKDSYNKMIGFKEGLKRFNNCVMNIENAKQVVIDYDKRQVLDDNITTKPIILDEFEIKKDKNLLFKKGSKKLEKQKLIQETKEMLRISMIGNDEIDYKQYIIDDVENKFDDSYTW